MTCQTNLALAGPDEPGYGFEQCGLAATGWAEQHKTIGRVDLETDLMRRPDHALWRAVFKAYTANVQQGFSGVLNSRLRLGARAGRVALRDSIHERLS
ncbi:hypothetical protein ALQ26_04246 [Pseudomonas amygdali pv. lachrymans]|nr:hypothetical protein ALQ26_04246 [Pseudomonas amygdali pv. lachrymans]